MTKVWYSVIFSFVSFAQCRFLIQMAWACIWILIIMSRILLYGVELEMIKTFLNVFEWTSYKTRTSPEAKPREIVAVEEDIIKLKHSLGDRAFLVIRGRYNLHVHHIEYTRFLQCVTFNKRALQSELKQMTEQLKMAINSADSRPRLMYEGKSGGLIFVRSHHSVFTKDY